MTPRAAQQPSSEEAKPADPQAKAPRAPRAPRARRPPDVPITAEHPDPERHLKPLDPAFAKKAAAALGQSIPRVRAVNPSDVEPIHCRAFFKADLKTGRLGVMEVTMQIPWEYRDRALSMIDLAGYPMELYMRPCARL